MKDLLYGLMLESYNDCAVVLAEYAAGSVEKFEKRVNQLAGKLGASNTHFVTPNGLDGTDKNGRHETTAQDLAKIISICIKKISTSLKLHRQNSIHLRMTVGREGLPVTIIMHCYLLCRELYLAKPGHLLRKRDIAMSEQ